MKARVWLIVPILAVALAGCQDAKSKLVGTWKAKPVPQKTSPNLRDVAERSFLGLFSQNMVLEFNGEGRVKISQALGSGTGNYTMKGNDIEVKLDSMAPNSTLKFRLSGDGKTLDLVREFESDATVSFEKTN